MQLTSFFLHKRRKTITPFPHLLSVLLASCIQFSRTIELSSFKTNIRNYLILFIKTLPLAKNKLYSRYESVCPYLTLPLQCKELIDTLKDTFNIGTSWGLAVPSSGNCGWLPFIKTLGSSSSYKKNYVVFLLPKN